MAEELEIEDRPVSPVGRVSHSFLRRRWPEFVFEFLLIIVGILAALAFDGWMQDRRDYGAETAYLELLREDLAQIEDEVQQYVAFERSNLAIGASALHAIADENLPGDTVKLGRLLSLTGGRRTLRIISAAYDDLTSTGNLQLIRDPKLRRLIVQYFATTKRTELVVDRNNSAFLDRMYFPYLIDAGVTIDLRPSPEPLVEEANKLVENALGPEFVGPVNEILTEPAGAEIWNNMRRRVLFRMLISAAGILMADAAIESTRQLREEIEEQLRNRI